MAGIAHNDAKLENFLWSDGQLLCADLESAVIIYSDQMQPQDLGRFPNCIPGTAYNQCPHAVLKGEVCRTTDVYSACSNLLMLVLGPGLWRADEAHKPTLAVAEMLLREFERVERSGELITTFFCRRANMHPMTEAVVTKALALLKATQPLLLNPSSPVTVLLDLSSILPQQLRSTVAQPFGLEVKLIRATSMAPSWEQMVAQSDEELNGRALAGLSKCWQSSSLHKMLKAHIQDVFISGAWQDVVKAAFGDERALLQALAGMPVHSVPWPAK